MSISTTLNQLNELIISANVYTLEYPICLLHLGG